MLLSEIQIRDPFVLPLESEGFYYLFGTTDKNAWSGPYEGFDCYRSQDLVNWEGPFPAFRPESESPYNANFWAPEVYEWQGRFVMFATFTESADDMRRGTHALIADRPEGPYLLWSDGPITPAEWSALDGTLVVESDGSPWMVFCHEWRQVRDGRMCAVKLTEDLKAPIGEPVTLFSASEAPWKQSLADGEDEAARHYVTDGPFPYRSQDGQLLLLWSSFGDQGYAMGLARSRTGDVLGPWTQDEVPVWSRDGGHGMLFRTFDGRLLLTFHSPNQTPRERAIFLELTASPAGLELKTPVTEL